MHCNMYRRFPRLFKPLVNMESCFRNNFVYFSQQRNEEQGSSENPFMRKYADKIRTFQNLNPEEYQNRLEKLKAKEKPKKIVMKEKKTSIREDLSNPPSVSCAYGKKTLGDIMKLDLLKDKSSFEIEMIWKHYHKEKPGLYAVLPSDMFERISAKLTKYPTFLFPLPKAQGYEFVFCQYSGNSCHFTQLINYQAYKENAPVCLTITYYSDLQDKGIILMRGELDENVMKAHEAQCLVNQLQLYYGGNDTKKDRLLWNFNKSPDSFKHMDLVSELEFGVAK